MLVPHSPLGPTLETARLWLRPPVESDFENYVKFHQDPDTMTFIGGVTAPAICWRTFRSLAGSWTLDGFSMFSVIEKSTGQWIGRIGPLYPLGWPAREIGWGLMREATGKGYAVEAAAATMDYAITQLGWDDVVHSIDPANLGSQQVAKRLGSTLRGPSQLPAPFENSPIELWGQTAAEWQKNRKTIAGLKDYPNA